MTSKVTQPFKSTRDVHLISLLRKVLAYWKLFLISIGTSLLIGALYIISTAPTYEVATSLLIDPSGSNRMLGESQYVDGGVSLIEIEKNLFNEIGILKSFKLVEQTVEDLDLDVTYESKNGLLWHEKYDYFPFKVIVDRSKPQLYDVSFNVDLLANDNYRLSFIANNLKVYRPENATIREIDRRFEFSDTFKFGENVAHEYFNFILIKPNYEIAEEDFQDQKLRFTVFAPKDIAQARLDGLEVDNIDLQASIFQIVSAGSHVNKEIDFLNELTTNYLENKLDTRNQIALTKEAFIRDQLAVATDSLTRAEIKLEAFKRDNDAIDLGSTATNAMQVTQGLQVNRAKLQLNIQYYNSVISYIQNNRNSDQFVIPSSSGITDPLINDNILELKELYGQRAKKKFYVTNNNEEISILNEQIRQSTQRLIANLRNAVQAARSRLGGVNAQLEDYDGMISELPTREKQLLSLQREQTLYENLFNYLSQELAKTGIARAENVSDTQVLDEPRMVGSGPVSPQKMLIGLLALAVGTLIPMTWLVWFSPDDLIEKEEQIRANTEIPLIASVVHHDPDHESDTNLWQVKESFRDMSANLRFVNSNTKCVIGMTSIMPEEGKTYCAINLGITLAETGKRVLIIDTDLRKPSLVKGFQNKSGIGLTDFLSKAIEKPWEMIYSHDSVKNLHFIPTSVAEGNIQELLSSKRMKSLLDQMKETYDYVILDTPAVGLVSDILLLWDQIDINLFVVRRQVAKIGFLKDFENLNNKGKKNKSFIIFNDALKRDYKYGYGPKYGVNQENQLINDSLSV